MLMLALPLEQMAGFAYHCGSKTTAMLCSQSTDVYLYQAASQNHACLTDRLEYAIFFEHGIGKSLCVEDYIYAL